ncbi:hypothetical protein MUP77_02275 [Candidatus Bathyarchaeota archaeon]|nr:hypothetical protein [Candidatus Bathyarchaeota archaeon]
MKAKLQKQLAYKYKDKRQYKHVIVVPEEAVNELCWKGGQELDLAVKDGRLIVELSSEQSSASEK